MGYNVAIVSVPKLKRNCCYALISALKHDVIKSNDTTGDMDLSLTPFKMLLI